jgi:tripartite-type tricarboxylate transporter receptor subunit TctC
MSTRFIRSILFASAAFCVAAQAQTYPAKPIRLIVPNAPGGGTDTVARLIAEKLSPHLGQQILVDNRGGAGGRIAAELVARSLKDGYTLMLGSAATLITGPALVADRKYDEVLGVHMIGPRSTELIAEAVLALRLECTVEELIRTIHAHPTFSEAVGEAAHAVHGAAIHA